MLICDSVHFVSEHRSGKFDRATVRIVNDRAARSVVALANEAPVLEHTIEGGCEIGDDEAHASPRVGRAGVRVQFQDKLARED